jgi:tetratricopeptide (TPR) repeat protein
MEAVVIFIVLGIYVGIRLLLGGGETDYEKKLKKLTKGALLIKKKDYETARIYFDNVIAVNPQNAVAYGLRSKCFYHLNDFENAIIDAAKANILDNSYPEPYIIKAKCLIEYNEYEEAIKEAEKAVWYMRKNPEAYMVLGLAWLKAGDLSKAEEYLFTAYRLGEENALYHLPAQSKHRLLSFKKQS